MRILDPSPRKGYNKIKVVVVWNICISPSKLRYCPMNLALLDPTTNLPDRITLTLGPPGILKSDPGNSTPSGKEGPDSARKRSSGKLVGSGCALRDNLFSAYSNRNFLASTAIVYDCSNDPAKKRKPSEGTAQLDVPLKEYPTVAKFNRRGTHLAVAYSSGKLVVHDFVSNNVISALYWPSNFLRESTISFFEWGYLGQAIIAGGRQSPVLRRFDFSQMNENSFSSTEAIEEVVLPSMPTSIHMHPRSDRLGISSLEDGKVAIFRLDDSRRGSTWFLPELMAINEEIQLRKTDEKKGSVPAQKRKKSEGEVFTLAMFVRTKKENGELISNILAVKECMAICVFQLNIQNGVTDHVSNMVMTKLSERDSGLSSKPCQFAKSSNDKYICIATNDQKFHLFIIASLFDGVGDKFNPIKVFEIPEKVHTHFRPTIDFSSQCEHVVGSCNHDGRYRLYFWNTNSGRLDEMLLGPNVDANHIHCHPTRAFVAVSTKSIGEDLDYVDIWGPSLNWQKFAPNFTGIQENIEYIEKEGMACFWICFSIHVLT